MGNKEISNQILTNKLPDTLGGFPIVNNQISKVDDLNDIIQNGFYTIVQAISNGPGWTNAFALIVVGNNSVVSPYVVQIAFHFSQTTIKARSCNAGTWSAWKTISIS